MFNLPSVKNFDVAGKKVLLRTDFNVLSDGGEVEEVYRVDRSLPVIKLLKDRGAKVIILSHLSSKKFRSLSPVADYLQKKINLKFLQEMGFSAISKEVKEMKNGDILMLENLRLYDGEEKNGEEFSKKLSSLGDIYVNEAFSASHRSHASIVGITRYLSSCAGLLFEEEVETLSSLFKPERPFLVILGGVKFGSKLGVLDKFLNIADHVFVGGALANNFFIAKGENIGRSIFDNAVSVEKYLDNAKVILPADVIKKDGKILDVGANSIEEIKKLVKDAKFILWNGPMGNMEEGFGNSTEEIAKAIADSGAKSVVGGGETIEIICKLDLFDKFSFVSTAGGAMLEFLAKGTLPGIEALRKCNVRHSVSNIC